MRKLALFISGTGGNALNLVQACREGRVPGEPALVVSSSLKAPGNERLASLGLPVVPVLRGSYPDDAAFSSACYEAVEAAGAEVICLCGWLKRLEVPERWAGRILNIHPGLLPKYGGAGMYGLHVHRAVIAAGESESGCTVHVVDGEYDHGDPVAVAKVPVLAGDDAQTLQKRVYEQEMQLYPEALRAFLKNLT